MDIPEKNFITVSQFLHEIDSYPNIGWIYRGHGNVSWELMPKAGRQEFHLPAKPDWETQGFPPRDIGRFREWRKLAVAYCDALPQNDFECLAFAQHYGLATRLLDWTTNPLVALYFAVESHSDIDGAMYCYLPWVLVNSDVATLAEFPEVAHYNPRPFDRRILVQSGVFTYHPQPNQPLTPGEPDERVRSIAPDGVNLVRFNVRADLKGILQRQLSEIGVSRKTLFPDLDGLSTYINWQTNRSVLKDGVEA